MKKLCLMLVTIIMIMTLIGCESKDENKLESYVDNYNEVVDVICKEFNTDNISIAADSDKNTKENLSTLKQFGNGNYYIIVNDISFCISCSDRIACLVGYDNGSEYKVLYTKSDNGKAHDPNNRKFGNGALNVIETESTSFLP